MTQSDIYRLLLTVLLFANRQLSSINSSADASQNDNCPNCDTSSASVATSNASSASDFSYTGINDLLLLVMFTSLFSPDGDSSSGTTF